MKKEKVMEYHPSLMITEYKLGSYCMFIRNNTAVRVLLGEIDKDNGVERLKHTKTKTQTDIQGGYIEPDNDGKREEGGGYIEPYDVGQGTGYIEPDNDEQREGNIGYIEPDVLEEVSSFAKFTDRRKKSGIYTYEAGYIVGINKEEEKIYVQFEDSIKDNTCQIFRTGINPQDFDILDKMIQNIGESY